MLKCFVFFQTTIGMMMMLDVMECIMHVVRLHWVEWMGKFYQGGGKLFMPERLEEY
jgi:V-type H+-transporting ATPase subunit a